MTIKELRDIYEGSSTKASDINRKLIFAGIAIVWIFRNATVGTTENIFPEEFKPILLLFCLSLCSDVLQYIVRAVVWHIYYHFHRVPEDKEESTQAEEPEWWNTLSDSLWYFKFIPTIFAYLNLASLLGITALQDSAIIQNLSGWSICNFWGIIFGILMVWYVITDNILERKGIKKGSSRICKCIRVVVGVFALVACALKIVFMIYS